jgi:hypothetical protein
MSKKKAATICCTNDANRLNTGFSCRKLGARRVHRRSRQSLMRKRWKNGIRQETVQKNVPEPNGRNADR